MTDTYAAPVSQPRTPTRERILDAALDLFIERGVAGTTVSDIERAVGLAAGTGSFYRHYKSKEELVVPAFLPELQDVFIDALGMREWDLQWPQDRIRTIAIAALTGFQQLAMLDQAYYGKIDFEEFVAALVEFTEIAESGDA
jgi:AcrR family transcriptional regulator